MRTKMTLEESQEYARNQWPNKKEFDLCRLGKTVKIGKIGLIIT